VPRVSVTIITLNESAHIAAAIDSAGWADEVVVVDAGSADDTVAIARAKGARTFTRDWPGYVDQKNHAASLAAHDWILSLDADERVTPPLADEIRGLLAGEPAQRGYRVPRVTFHLGRWIRSTDFYPDYQTRLYDRRAARWQGRYVHESVAVEGGTGQLTGELQHYSYRDLSDHLDRINRYTTLAARQMYESGRRAGVVDLLLHPPAAFVRNYLLRRGFTDGMAGLTLSLVNSYSVLLKFAKLWEMESLIPRPRSRISDPESPIPKSERDLESGSGSGSRDQESGTRNS
jgi:glycosyltransferase involved in cell wall biosynthesis